MQDKDRQHKDVPLEVIKGDIRIGKELSDFQFMLREWFFTCYIIGTLILSAIHVTALFAFYTYWKFQKRQQGLQDLADNDPSVGLDLNDAELEADESPWIDLPVPDSIPSNPGSRQDTIDPGTEAPQESEESQGRNPSTGEAAIEEESSMQSEHAGVQEGRIGATETVEDEGFSPAPSGE